jgi:hypothetical protein
MKKWRTEAKRPQKICGLAERLHPHIARRAFLAISGTFVVFVDCDGSGGTGKPAVAYGGRTESCPGGFFMP